MGMEDATRDEKSVKLGYVAVSILVFLIYLCPVYADYFVNSPLGRTLDAYGGVVKVSSTDIYDLILYYGLEKRQFYVAAPEMFGAVGVYGGVPITEDIVSKVNKVAEAGKVKDIKGANAYSAASELMRQKFPTSTQVIVARGDIGADSLAAMSYANLLGVPLILTEPNSLRQEAQETMSKLFARGAVVIGREAAISDGVFAKLPGAVRIGGKDRYETAVLVAEKVMEKRAAVVETIIITDGEALDPNAVLFMLKYNAPVVYTRGSEIPASTGNFLKKYKFKRVIIVGSSAAASEIENLVKGR